MKVYLNSITGIDDAIVTMYMSKRSWTKEKEDRIRYVVSRVLDRTGKPYEVVDNDLYDEFWDMFSKLLKWGRKHITMLRYIDLSITVEGLHRGAQDDFDSHAKRFDNRIIRSSTRLATFGDEMSDWYKDKIMTTDHVCSLLNILLPPSVKTPEGTFVKTTNGYIREDLQDDKDVKRGLYMLSIPSNFIYKCNITEFAHVVKERDINSAANPELKQMMELTIDALHNWFYQFSREFFYDIKN
jgi:hypothetical protein